MPPVFRGLTGEDGDGHLAYSGESVAREVGSIGGCATGWVNGVTSHSLPLLLGGVALGAPVVVWRWVRLQSPGRCRPLFDSLFPGPAVNLPNCRLGSLFSEVPQGVSCLLY